MSISANQKRCNVRIKLCAMKSLPTVHVSDIMVGSGLPSAELRTYLKSEEEEEELFLNGESPALARKLNIRYESSSYSISSISSCFVSSDEKDEESFLFFEDPIKKRPTKSKTDSLPRTPAASQKKHFRSRSLNIPLIYPTDEKNEKSPKYISPSLFRSYVLHKPDDNNRRGSLKSCYESTISIDSPSGDRAVQECSSDKAS
jgi:hypothetical protein